ncbi:MAG: phosphodiester glycosidase family protein [Vicinamibacterales bacterium]
MIKTLTVLGAAVAACGLTTVAVGQSQVAQPYVGIAYVDRLETSPRPLHMHIAQIDLTAPGLHFKVSPPGGTRELARQTTLDYLKTQHAQLAVNAHFFLPFPSPDTDAWAIGLGASEGRVFSAFEAPQQDFALVTDAPALNIDAQNHAAIVHRDPAEAGGRSVREAVTLWNAVAGSAQIVTSGVATVPVYQDATHPGGLLKAGGQNDYSNEKSWYAVATARTAIGLSRDGRTLTLFTVDVRGGSEGMRLSEVAAVLIKDYGVWDALNLDGGGSTSMALEDPQTHVGSLVNTSSDNPAGRSVASSLAVFARPK